MKRSYAFGVVTGVTVKLRCPSCGWKTVAIEQEHHAAMPLCICGKRLERQ